MTRDFVVTARAKGLAPGRIIVRHVLRNAVIPAVTALGIQIGRLIGGAVLTEAVFNLPGLGTLLWSALVQRDYFVIQAVTLLAVLLFVLVNLATDIAYGVIDPRIRTGGAMMFRISAGALGTGLSGVRDPDRLLTAPWLTPYDPLAQDLDHALQLPTLSHWLGTDDLGRDLLSRLMLGTRVSVAVGFGSAFARFVDRHCRWPDRRLSGRMAQRHDHAHLRCAAGVSRRAAGDAGGHRAEGRHTPA